MNTIKKAFCLLLALTVLLSACSPAQPETEADPTRAEKHTKEETAAETEPSETAF